MQWLWLKLQINRKTSSWSIIAQSLLNIQWKPAAFQLSALKLPASESVRVSALSSRINSMNCLLNIRALLLAKTFQFLRKEVRYICKLEQKIYPFLKLLFFFKERFHALCNRANHQFLYDVMTAFLYPIYKCKSQDISNEQKICSLAVFCSLTTSAK